MSKRAALIACVLLVACAPVGPASTRPNEEPLPAGWKAVVTPGNRWTYVIPVAMDDGTRCVVTAANGQGNGISCNWR